MHRKIGKVLSIILSLTMTFSVQAAELAAPDRYDGNVYQETTEYIAKKDISQCHLEMETVSLVYNAAARTVPVTVTDDGTELKENVDFTVTYEDNINAGTAAVIVKGMGAYEGELRDTFEIVRADISSGMVTKNLSNVKAQYSYIDMTIQPPIKMNQGSYNLSSMKDYEIDYVNNYYPGTATMTIRGVGNYTGTIIKTFTITKRAISTAKVKAQFDAWKRLVVTVSIPDNGRMLIPNVDYRYSVATNALGKVTITVTGIGKNCYGTTVHIIAAEDNPNRPVPMTIVLGKVTVKRATIKKAVNLKGKKIKLSWRKVSGAGGYQIRYALSKKKLKKAKLKKVKKNKVTYTIRKLKKRKYFIQVRAYKIVNKKTYYGAWSKTKKVKVRK